MPDSRLRAYVAWVPVLRSRSLEPAARSESGGIADSRVAQFFDPDGALSKAYAGVIGLPRPTPAWDVYFVFGPDVRWPAGQGTDEPPKPTYWMHQLGGSAPEGLRLDGERLARIVRALLAKKVP